jgi:hypothetical protein
MTRIRLVGADLFYYLLVGVGLVLLVSIVQPFWSVLFLAALGLFYGLFGVLRLGVLLDAGLVLGAITVLVAALRSERPPDLPSRRERLQAPHR